MSSVPAKPGGKWPRWASPGRSFPPPPVRRRRRPTGSTPSEPPTSSKSGPGPHGLTLLEIGGASLGRIVEPGDPAGVVLFCPVAVLQGHVLDPVHRFLAQA